MVYRRERFACSKTYVSSFTASETGYSLPVHVWQSHKVPIYVVLFRKLRIRRSSWIYAKQFRLIRNFKTNLEICQTMRLHINKARQEQRLEPRQPALCCQLSCGVDEHFVKELMHFLTRSTPFYYLLSTKIFWTR